MVRNEITKRISEGLFKDSDLSERNYCNILYVLAMHEGPEKANEMYLQAHDNGKFINVAYIRGGCDGELFLIRDIHPSLDHYLTWTRDNGEYVIHED